MKKYENGTNFTFIRTFDSFESKLGETLKKLNSILYGVVEAKPYLLDWDVIIPEYQKYYADGGDLDKFCQSHVLAESLLKGFSQDDALKEAMYLHLRAEILAKKENGELEKHPLHNSI